MGTISVGVVIIIASVVLLLVAIFLMKRKRKIAVEVDNTPSPNQIDTTDAHETHLSVTQAPKEFSFDTMYYNIEQYEMTTNDCYVTTKNEYLNVRIYQNCNS